MSSTEQSSDFLSTPKEDGAAVSIEQLMQQYHLTVFTLSMHLLNDKRVAENVVEEVFLQLSRTDSIPSDEKELTSLIHATTYDVALSELVRIRVAKTAN